MLSDLTVLLYILFLLFSIGAVAYQLWRRNWFDILPSLMWIILMEVPFLIFWNRLVEGPRELQAAGIVIVGAALLIGDQIKLRSQPPDFPQPLKNSFFRFIAEYYVYLLLAFFIFIVSYHVLNLRQIPLIEKYFGHASTEQLKVMREESSKLLDVPLVFKYLFTWTIVLISPLTFLLLIRDKRYIGAWVFLSIAILYANITLAQTFVLSMLVSIGLTYLFAWKPKLNKILLLGFIGIILIIGIRVLWFLSFNQYSLFKYQPQAVAIQKISFPAGDPRNRLTLADNYRLIPEAKLTKEEKVYNYLVYRVFLGPVDVSCRWYQYYPKYSQGYYGVADLFKRDSGYVPPSRKLALWAYTQKFPWKYLDSANAYASLDADGYARLGFIGILVAAFILLGFRIIFKVLLVDTMLSKILYGIGVTLLAILPVQAGIQAILIAHGVLMISLLMMLPRFGLLVD
ncbi:MAG: hypothetical protein K6U80_11055 [Firmicutes bacterium]|nr:hypothetical protein [Bacillota bacterium]